MALIGLNKSLLLLFFALVNKWRCLSYQDLWDYLFISLLTVKVAVLDSFDNI